MSFFKSNKSEEENTQLRNEILVLKQMVQKNKSNLDMFQKESLESQKNYQEMRS